MSAKWRPLASVCLAMFVLIAFVMMVPLALPDVQHRLAASFSELQWIINAYVMTQAALLLTAGALADRIGRRRVYLVGLSVGAAAALLCALAPSVPLLIAASALLGGGGAMTLATSLALLGRAYEGSDRATAFGAWGGAIAAALAIGPLAGGLLIAAFGWRAVFIFFVPFTLSALAIGAAGIEESRDIALAHNRGDWVGAATLSAALFALLFGLINGNRAGFASPPIAGAFATAIALLGGFIVVERRLSRAGGRRAPMLELALFRIPSFTGAAIAAACGAFANFGLTFYVTVYFTNVLGDTAGRTGLKLLTITLPSMAASLLSGRLLARLSARLLLTAALGLVAIGNMLLFLGTDRPAPWTTLLPGFVLIGLGAGALNPPLGATAVGAVSPDKAGLASGVNNTFRQAGTALGIAVLGALLQAHMGHALRHLSDGISADAVGLAASGRFAAAAAAAAPALREQIVVVAARAFMSGLQELFAVMAIVAAIGALSAFALVRATPTAERAR